MNFIIRSTFSPYRGSKLKSPHSSLTSTFRGKNPKISPIRLRPTQKHNYSETKTEHPTASISTTDSNNPKNLTSLEEINMVKTPTTVHDEPESLNTLEECLNMYFNCKNITFYSNPPIILEKRVSHRYTKTQQLRKIKPQRSETPEIPTRNHKSTPQEPEKLPLVSKKLRKKSKKSCSPGPYDLCIRTKSNPRAKTPFCKMKQRNL
ncbi:hypothetical protein SteCoe_4622 [Stentor coeruleus]|uniref:Uncharacterized protein n=1 Tax=Stentor coeruleus TaxID=5963 RepID=A0A1R2CUE8_9CILI|nr:hypothetical protein SteCoe_4622 [Stentor coeruleus]